MDTACGHLLLSTVNGGSSVLLAAGASAFVGAEAAAVASGAAALVGAAAGAAVGAGADVGAGVSAGAQAANTRANIRGSAKNNDVCLVKNLTSILLSVPLSDHLQE